MPRIFDNIDQSLLPALRDTLNLADRADFCVGYFNLRDWKQLDSYTERWSDGDGHCCRLLVGMSRQRSEELRAARSLTSADGEIDNQTTLRLKKKLAEDFGEQQLSAYPPTRTAGPGGVRLHPDDLSGGAAAGEGSGAGGVP